ncbi:hypothetical protein MBORA_15850 [Methanobrevibacter oralis]|uniref:Uncharacterized protein n=1 Tax=Methanobrevibacter oralis TaxID=66851 RepID=A0A162FKE8_METOA|nr:hypothetical protein [Methanobrevibacter oralis]KZX11340.1 hypothetical protein MBORA_15850 [Methanobrevibacter oralis]
MISTGDSEMDYVIKTLDDKGYGPCNIKLDWINEHPFIVLYCLEGVTELVQKFNYLGVGVLPIKDSYTMGVPGINLNRNISKVVEYVDQITNKGEDPKMDGVKSIEDVKVWLKLHYPHDIQDLLNMGIDNDIGIINVLNHKYQLGLMELTTNGIISDYVDVEGVIV